MGSYKDTLNMPKTDFPMRGNLPEREPIFQRFWEERGIFKKLKERNAPLFILHDGPPYSNGHIHIGHALNKTLKDILVRYKALRGYRISFVLGWDNHGMPIEKEVVENDEEIKKLVREKGIKDPEVKLKIRQKSREFAKKWVEIQKEEFKRLGVLTDWDDIYLTMDPNFEADETELLAELIEKGYIYRGYMPLPWSRESQSALAMAEIEYYEKESPSLWFLTKCLDEEFYILVWTTTPWTLFGNRAFAFSPIMEYLFAKVDGKVVVFGKENAERIREELGWEWEVLRVENGKYFEYKKFQHPLFSDRVSLGILADFVSSEEGSGIVHIAPGHGKEDYEVGKIYNLEVFSPVDEVGNFTQDADRQTKYPLNVAGKSIEEGGERAIERLKELGFFVKLGKYRHSYPHDWRYKKPLIFRATGQWFLSVDHQNLRERALKAIKEDVKWHPEESINRIYMSVKERPDWVISRQRAWGVFIPAVKCKDCGEVILDPEIVRNLAKKIREGNSDAWLTEDIKEFLPENFTCKNCNGKDFEKEYDILDVWFDSGSTNIAVLDRRGIGWPADVYLEGWDQHRGWFNASLMIGMASKGKPPYRAVITHGFVLDHLGRAMHKSLGNVVSPQEVIGKYGADVLRLWVASSDYTEDIRIGDEIMARVVDAYRKIRNTYRYLLSNLYDFDKPLEYSELLPIDRWALSKLYTLVKDCREHYENFAFEKVFRDAYNFIVDMSSFYFEALKDRLYTYAPKSRERRSAQTSLYYILYHLLMIFAPIIPHTVEEAWGFSPFKENSESVFLEVWNDLPESFRDEELEREFEVILRMRDEVYPILEVLRRERKVIGQNLDARIEVKPKGDYGRILEKYKPYLVEIFGVSQFLMTDNPKGEESLDGEYGLWKVSHALGKKCPRCWMWFEEEFEGVCSKCSKAFGEIHLI